MARAGSATIATTTGVITTTGITIIGIIASIDEAWKSGGSKRVRRPFWAPDLCLPRSNFDALQSQFLNFQDLSFQGVSVSIRHCSQRSGGQWLRRDLSLTSGLSTSGANRRRVWRVASLIRSTKTGLSAMVRSCETARLSQGSVCSQLLKDSLRECLDLEARGALPPLPDIDKMPGDRRCRRHRRRHQMGAALESLTALEIAVRGRGAALFRQ